MRGTGRELEPNETWQHGRQEEGFLKRNRFDVLKIQDQMWKKMIMRAHLQGHVGKCCAALAEHFFKWRRGDPAGQVKLLELCREMFENGIIKLVSRRKSEVG